MEKPIGYLKSVLTLICLALGFTFGGAAMGAGERLTGTVTANGKPVAGAIVTAKQHSSGIEVSVFTNLGGYYSLPLSGPGDHELQASWSTQTSAPVSQNVANAAEVRADISMQADPSYMDRIPSAEWLGLLPDGDMKREFLLNCTSCHELDGRRILIDGEPRNRAQWAAAFAAMRAIDQYNILPLDFDDAKVVQWLTDNLTKPAIATLTPPTPTSIEDLARVRITEYPLPNATELPHDLVVGPHGKVWITAFFTDVIWALDPSSGSIETIRVRPEGADGWGQARALTFDNNGQLWIILGGTHELVRLNPETHAVKTYDIGMYAHSLALDQRGRIWFNDYFAEQEKIGVFDPKTESVKHIKIPSAGLSKAQGLPLPYGLQIDSQGRLYSTQMAANTVVMYDTNSGSAELWRMPQDNAAPRRPAIGNDDTLWIPEWNTGFLSQFEPTTQTFKRYRLAASALGAYDAEFDPTSGQVWVTGALASSMVAFDPKTERVLEVPLPTNPGYTRHLAVDPRSGDLWSAYSSLPAAIPKVVRIERR